MKTRTAINYWPDTQCAKAFWGQHELPPYRQLREDTLDSADPKAGQEWLDLGCGGGSLSKGIWERTHGTVGRVVGLDCAAANERAYEYLQRDLTPTPGDRIRFVCADFSSGLGLFPDASFDRVISGLSISYAESIDPVTGDWSTQAYDAVLSEVHRLLRPGGAFVFSVNVPNPKWTRVGLRSLRGVFGAKRPLRYLQKSWRMYRYGAWLTREARTGRFHYLPAEDVTARLTEAGFTQISHRLSYCDQAYIFTCVRS